MVTRSNTNAVQRSHYRGRPRGSNRGVAVADGNDDVNAAGNNDALPIGNDMVQEGPAVVSLDDKKYEELISMSISKGWRKSHTFRSGSVSDSALRGFFCTNSSGI